MKSAIASDADYLAAVKAGDMNEAQQMVDHAAKKAGYNVGPVFHGTPSAKNQTVEEVVRDAKQGLTTSDFPFNKFSKKYKTERGIFFHDSQRTAQLYAKATGAVGRFFLKDVEPRRRLGDGYEYSATDPSQIKSADPITYDKSGSVIPLSKRFDSNSEEITNPVVPTGDTKKSQRMVDAAAKKAGYTFGPFYHGSGWSSHNVFERGKSPSGRLKPYPNYGLDDIGFWFTSSKSQANEYGSVLQMEGGKRPPTRLYNVFLNIKNPLEFADHQEFNEWINSYAKNYAVDEKSKALMKEGRSLLGSLNVNMLLERLKMGKKDGIVIWKGNGDQRFGLLPNESYPTWAIVFEPNQIKLADPMTYDKSGKLISLSKRFDSSRSEITNPVVTREERQAKIEKLKELTATAKKFWDKGGLTRTESEKFRTLMAEANDLRFDLQKPLTVDKIPSETERLSTMPADMVITAHEDLMRDRKIYTPIVDAAIGVSFNAETAIDQIITGKKANVSAQQFYDAFDSTRAAMRKHYGDTVKLWRASGSQKTKATTNWATTEAFAKQFGGNVISKEIPIDEVIAVNVGFNGKYHEIIVGKKPKGIEEITNPVVTTGDADYLAAVKAGATDWAQQMVVQAAKAAGYLDASELSGPKYNEGDPVYHNTTSKFTAFKAGKNGLIQFTPSKTLFGKRGDIKVAAYLKEPVIRNSTGLILSVKDPSQAKLADPITYDKSGKVIPLSKRFDSNSEEITNPAGRIPAQFPFEYASYLKQHFPEIWRLGGNIRGNDAFRWWSAYRQGDRSPTVTHWWAVTRPAWIARHYRDHRIAGVVAQIKWGTIGSLGVAGMKRVIETKIRNSR